MGTAAVEEQFKTLGALLSFQSFEPQQFFAAGPDTVFVLGHYDRTVIKTGKKANSDFVHVFVIRDGKIASYRRVPGHRDARRRVAGTSSASVLVALRDRQVVARAPFGPRAVVDGGGDAERVEGEGEGGGVDAGAAARHHRRAEIDAGGLEGGAERDRILERCRPRSARWTAR